VDKKLFDVIGEVFGEKFSDLDAKVTDLRSVIKNLSETDHSELIKAAVLEHTSESPTPEDVCKLIDENISKYMSENPIVVPEPQPGVGLMAPLWSKDDVCREGHIVQHNAGQYFIAAKDTASEPGKSEDWQRIGKSGFRWTGVKKKNAEYSDGDLFIDGGSTFIWFEGKGRMFAQRGKDAATIKDLRFEVDRFVVTMSDDSFIEGELSLYSNLKDHAEELMYGELKSYIENFDQHLIPELVDAKFKNFEAKSEERVQSVIDSAEKTFKEKAANVSRGTNSKLTKLTNDATKRFDRMLGRSKQILDELEQRTTDEIEQHQQAISDALEKANNHLNAKFIEYANDVDAKLEDLPETVESFVKNNINEFQLYNQYLERLSEYGTPVTVYRGGFKIDVDYSIGHMINWQNGLYICVKEDRSGA